MKHGDLITIVLEHEANVVDGSRLVHTSIYEPFKEGVDLIGEFTADYDDRPSHLVTDEGRTWLRGHAAFDSPGALRLLRHAEIEDAKRKGVTR